jgi:hypothetical protein
VGGVLLGLHRVEMDKVLSRRTLEVAARAGQSFGIVLYALIWGVVLLPWLAAQLILYWLLPIARKKCGRLSAWMLHEELDKLRLKLGVLVLACAAYGMWIIPWAISDRSTLFGIWEDCPVVQDEVWIGCFGFLLGPVWADISMVQGWLCFAAALHLGLLALIVPGLGRFARRHCTYIPARSLFAMLHANSPRDDATLTRFGPGKLLVGQPREAATGIFGFIGCSEDELRERMARSVVAIVDEAEALEDEVLSECLSYVLHERAGHSERTFQNCGLRDRAPDGSELPGRHGMTLADFCALDVARDAQLSEAHVAALRLYSTAAFAAISQPMRNLKTRRARSGEKADANGRVPIEPPQLREPHPLPVTMAFIYEGLKRMRAVSAGVHEPGVHEPGSVRSEEDGPSEILNRESTGVWVDPSVLPAPMGPASPHNRAPPRHPREYFAGVRIVAPEAVAHDPPPAVPPQDTLALAGRVVEQSAGARELILRVPRPESGAVS